MKSKAILFILFWNFFITVLYEMGRNFAILTFFSNHNQDTRWFNASVPLFGAFAVLLLFYPLAGFIADNCCGRYKTVILSLRFVWCGLFALCVGLVLLLMPFHNNAIILSAYFIAAVIPLTLLLIGVCGFQVNIVQFGTDQLHDASTADIGLFIDWCYWSSFVATALTKVLSRMHCVSITVDKCIFLQTLCIPFIVLVALTISFCAGCERQKRFVVDSGSRNPYKLVYRVLRFAAKNKCPIQRSAFTYCEDELPSRIDFGKHKYGGPFTTEEVEDVKTFLRILGLLAALGLAFTIEIPVYYVLPFLEFHMDDTTYDRHTAAVISSESMPPILLSIIIPLYIFTMRPVLHNHIPGSVKKMGVGMIFLAVSVVYSFAIDTAEHILQQGNKTCLFHIQQNENTITQHKGHYAVIVQSFLTSMAYLFIYIPVIQFVCAQSPHSMKGLLIGTVFAIKGVFQLLGVVIIMPFYFWKPLIQFPSCGFGYYLVNVFIAIVGLVVYTVAARRYKYRQRDEPCNVRRFVEEYYGRIQEEPYYDYEPID